MVDFHGDDPHWLAGCGERELLLLQGFRCLAVAPDPDSARLYFDFYLVGFDTSQFKTDPEARGTLKNVDRRTPLNSGITKIGKMDFRYLVGDLANLALEKPQTERTGFSAHHPQWTRWSSEATGNSSGVEGERIAEKMAKFTKMGGQCLLSVIMGGAGCSGHTDRLGGT
jgi:hypothetical protein